MIDDKLYALMAGSAYVSNRAVENLFPVPQGWVAFKHRTLDSGFEAVSFTNGSEIVISFAGTDPNSPRDWVADYRLAEGKVSSQLLQAAAYYMEVRALYGNDVTISFTGHSLGGGLAALLCR